MENRREKCKWLLRPCLQPCPLRADLVFLGLEDLQVVDDEAELVCRKLADAVLVHVYLHAPLRPGARPGGQLRRGFPQLMASLS